MKTTLLANLHPLRQMQLLNMLPQTMMSNIRSPSEEIRKKIGQRATVEFYIFLYNEAKFH